MYKRVLLKISGEALAGEAGVGIDSATVEHIVSQVVELYNSGVEIGIVVGGGNFWRGRQGTNMDRVTADHMGMIATIMNALALQDAIEKKGVDGVYDSDPKTNPAAKKIDTISYMEIMNRNLNVMDFTSLTLCMENRIPIVAFGLNENDGLIKAARGEKIGTTIK